MHEFVVSNPRAYLVAYDSGMDFLDQGGCVHPKTFSTWLSEVKNTDRGTLFSETELSKGTELLRKTLEIEQLTRLNVKTQAAEAGSVSSHVTVERTKKAIKLQQLAAVSVGLIGLAIGIFSDPRVSDISFLICGISAMWLLVAIPVQKWWHHG